MCIYNVKKGIILHGSIFCICVSLGVFMGLCRNLCFVYLCASVCASVFVCARECAYITLKKVHTTYERQVIIEFTSTLVNQRPCDKVF